MAADFNVGDRVRVVATWPTRTGCVGTITATLSPGPRISGWSLLDNRGDDGRNEPLYIVAVDGDYRVPLYADEMVLAVEVHPDAT